MPKLRPPRQQQEEPVIAFNDHEPPTEDIVIDLSPEELDAIPPIDGSDPDLHRAEPVEPAEPAADPLKVALEAQQRAEQLQLQYQRERDDAIRRTQDREAELARARDERADAEYATVLTGIAAEEGAIAKAEGDYAAAMQSGDYAAAGRAQREMSTAAARLDRLQVNKTGLDQSKENRPTIQRTEPQRPASVEDQINSMQIPSEAKVWLRAHPDFVSDQGKVRQLNAVHDYVTTIQQVPQFSADYFDRLETQLGIKAGPKVVTAAAQTAAPQPQPQQRRSMPVTAPVSRDVPTASGERTQSTGMTLTAEERFIARNSFTAEGMTNAQKEKQYAINKAKLARERAAGRYPARERA